MRKRAWKRYGGEVYRHYQVVEGSFNYKIMNLQAAIGSPQLESMQMKWNREQEIWQRYNNAFVDYGLPAPGHRPARLCAKQPMQEYKRESYEMFTQLLQNI